ncbi:uncharacterized protein LOC120836214 [Ixodes scapularis]|uniref:uncharacterized protein LOC120836214 n=1 Tax=Ixodes scapularis TaxID=6945 RepID=UPI001A9F1834|nr:uncharacterized protein LOC120836214 [Ixodes scapularis]
MEARRKLANETVEQCFNEKLNLARLCPLPEDQIVDYVITGISDEALVRSLSVVKFSTPEDLLECLKRLDDQLTDVREAFHRSDAATDSRAGKNAKAIVVDAQLRMQEGKEHCLLACAINVTEDGDTVLPILNISRSNVNISKGDVAARGSWCSEVSETAINRRTTDLLEPRKAADVRTGPQLCPDLSGRYRLTTEDGPIVQAPFKTRPVKECYCYNCAGQGQFGHQCNMKKRGNPVTPCIISYDDPHESQDQSRQSEGNWRAPRTSIKEHRNNDGGYDNKPSVSNSRGSRKKKKRTRSRACHGKLMRLSNDTYRIEDIPGHKRTQRFYASTAPVDKLQRVNTFDVDIEDTSSTYLRSLWSSRLPLLLMLLFIFLLRIPNAEMCQSHTAPVPTKPPSVPSQTRHVNLYLLSDHSHCQLFNNTGDQRLYMTVLTNGVRATYSGFPHALGLVLRLVGIGCLSESEQKRIYETSIKDGKLDGYSALWGLKNFAMQNPTQFENATVTVMLTAYYFQKESQTGYSFLGGFCSRDQVALVSDVHALYRCQEDVALHILRVMSVDLQEGSLKKCVTSKRESPECSLEKLSASLARMPQECFRPRGQEVPQVTSLPGDVVDLPKLCKAIYYFIPRMEHCFEHEITGMHRFNPVYNCELTCCVWKNSLDRKLRVAASIQGLRCGTENQFCVNGACYNREEWIHEHLPNGSLDIRPDVPRKRPF